MMVMTPSLNASRRPRATAAVYKARLGDSQLTHTFYVPVGLER